MSSKLVGAKNRRNLSREEISDSGSYVTWSEADKMQGIRGIFLGRRQNCRKNAILLGFFLENPWGPFF